MAVTPEELELMRQSVALLEQEQGADLSSADTRINELGVQIKALKSRVLDQADRISELKSTTTTQEAALVHRANELHVSTMQVSTANKTVGELKDRITDLQDTLRGQDDEIEGHEARVLGYAARIDELEGVVGEQASRLLRIEDSHAARYEKLDATNDRLIGITENAVKMRQLAEYERDQWRDRFFADDCYYQWTYHGVDVPTTREPQPRFVVEYQAYNAAKAWVEANGGDFSLVEVEYHRVS